jgi:hypothetical protein
MNDFKEPNKTIQRILEKHKSQFFDMIRFENNKRVADNTNDDNNHKNNDPKK